MKELEAKAIVDDNCEILGFRDHFGYFYPVDRGQILPGQFHCEIPMSKNELLGIVSRLDELVKEARHFNATLDLIRSPAFCGLKSRVDVIEATLEKAADAFSGWEED